MKRYLRYGQHDSSLFLQNASSDWPGTGADRSDQGANGYRARRWDSGG